jgi:hypothetical protein
MSDLIWLTEEQIRNLGLVFHRHTGFPGLTIGGLSVGSSLSSGTVYAGATLLLSMAHTDGLQPHHSLEPYGRVQQDIRRPCSQGGQALSVDDRKTL